MPSSAGKKKRVKSAEATLAYSSLHDDFDGLLSNCPSIPLVSCSTVHAHSSSLDFFFFNDTATTEIYTLSLHDALPIFRRIHRDEAGHVRLSRRIAAELVQGHVIDAVAENARLGLVGVLARRGAAFDRLGTDPERLFVRISRVPNGIFQ